MNNILEATRDQEDRQIKVQFGLYYDSIFNQIVDGFDGISIEWKELIKAEVRREFEKIKLDDDINNPLHIRDYVPVYCIETEDEYPAIEVTDGTIIKTLLRNKYFKTEGREVSAAVLSIPLNLFIINLTTTVNPNHGKYENMGGNMTKTPRNGTNTHRNLGGLGGDDGGGMGFSEQVSVDYEGISVERGLMNRESRLTNNFQSGNYGRNDGVVDGHSRNSSDLMSNFHNYNDRSAKKSHFIGEEIYQGEQYYKEGEHNLAITATINHETASSYITQDNQVRFKKTINKYLSYALISNKVKQVFSTSSIPHALLDIFKKNDITPIFPISENQARLLSKIINANIIDDPQIQMSKNLDKYIGTIDHFHKKDKITTNNKKQSNLIYVKENSNFSALGLTLYGKNKEELRQVKKHLRENLANLFHLLAEKEFAIVENRFIDRPKDSLVTINKEEVGEMKLSLRCKYEKSGKELDFNKPIKFTKVNTVPINGYAQHYSDMKSDNEAFILKLKDFLNEQSDDQKELLNNILNPSGEVNNFPLFKKNPNQDILCSLNTTKTNFISTNCGYPSIYELQVYGWEDTTFIGFLAKKAESFIDGKKCNKLNCFAKKSEHYTFFYFNNYSVRVRVTNNHDNGGKGNVFYQDKKNIKNVNQYDHQNLFRDILKTYEFNKMLNPIVHNLANSGGLGKGLYGVGTYLHKKVQNYTNKSHLEKIDTPIPTPINDAYNLNVPANNNSSRNRIYSNNIDSHKNSKFSSAMNQANQQNNQNPKKASAGYESSKFFIKQQSEALSHSANNLDFHDKRPPTYQKQNSKQADDNTNKKRDIVETYIICDICEKILTEEVQINNEKMKSYSFLAFIASLSDENQYWDKDLECLSANNYHDCYTKDFTNTGTNMNFFGGEHLPTVVSNTNTNGSLNNFRPNRLNSKGKNLQVSTQQGDYDGLQLLPNINITKNQTAMDSKYAYTLGESPVKSAMKCPDKSPEKKKVQWEDKFGKLPDGETKIDTHAEGMGKPLIPMVRGLEDESGGDPDFRFFNKSISKEEQWDTNKQTSDFFMNEIPIEEKKTKVQKKNLVLPEFAKENDSTNLLSKGTMFYTPVMKKQKFEIEKEINQFTHTAEPHHQGISNMTHDPLDITPHKGSIPEYHKSKSNNAPNLMVDSATYQTCKMGYIPAYSSYKTVYETQKNATTKNFKDQIRQIDACSEVENEEENSYIAQDRQKIFDTEETKKEDPAEEFLSQICRHTQQERVFRLNGCCVRFKRLPLTVHDLVPCFSFLQGLENPFMQKHMIEYQQTIELEYLNSLVDLINYLLEQIMFLGLILSEILIISNNLRKKYTGLAILSNLLTLKNELKLQFEYNELRNLGYKLLEVRDEPYLERRSKLAKNIDSLILIGYKNTQDHLQYIFDNNPKNRTLNIVDICLQSIDVLKNLRNISRNFTQSPMIESISPTYKEDTTVYSDVQNYNQSSGNVLKHTTSHQINNPQQPNNEKNSMISVPGLNNSTTANNGLKLSKIIDLKISNADIQSQRMSLHRNSTYSKVAPKITPISSKKSPRGELKTENLGHTDTGDILKTEFDLSVDKYSNHEVYDVTLSICTPGVIKKSNMLTNLYSRHKNLTNPSRAFSPGISRRHNSKTFMTDRNYIINDRSIYTPAIGNTACYTSYNFQLNKFISEDLFTLKETSEDHPKEACLSLLIPNYPVFMNELNRLDPVNNTAINKLLYINYLMTHTHYENKYNYDAYCDQTSRTNYLSKEDIFKKALENKDKEYTLDTDTNERQPLDIVFPFLKVHFKEAIGGKIEREDFKAVFERPVLCHNLRAGTNCQTAYYNLNANFMVKNWSQQDLDSTEYFNPQSDLGIDSDKFDLALSKWHHNLQNGNAKSLSVELTENLKHGQKIRVEIKEYFPAQFTALRLVLGVKYSQFLSSISAGEDFETSGGKTNSSFFKTKDGLFIGKVIGKTEADMFINSANSYFQYMFNMVNNKSDSVLTKILGLYYMDTNQKGKEYVVIMENLFCGIQNYNKLYDLKGSHVNRLVKINTIGQTLLDTNYLIDRNGDPLVITTGYYNSENFDFFKAIENDCDFLFKESIIDYSLMCIIDSTHKLVKVGIIDFFRKYDIYKKVENVGKKVYYGMNPTIVEPKKYCKRFKKAMRKYFIVNI